jgi:hypothetical protein
MAIFFAIVAEFSRIICSIMAKSLTTKTLNSAHIPASWITLCCIGHKNRCRSSLFHGGLSEKALFFAKEGTNSRFIMLDLVPSNSGLSFIRNWSLWVVSWTDWTELRPSDGKPA